MSKRCVEKIVACYRISLTVDNPAVVNALLGTCVTVKRRLLLRVLASWKTV